MRRRTPLALLVFSFFGCGASTAFAQAADPDWSVVGWERAVGLVNPVGLEHAASVGLRYDFSDADNPLLSDTRLELGAINYTSPLDSLSGLYAELIPLSLLVLRAEASWIAAWSADGLGAHRAAQSYEQAEGEAGVGHGLRLFLGATLRLAVPIGAWRVIALNEFAVEWVRMDVETENGFAPYYYRPRDDLIFASEEFVYRNHAMLLFESPLAEGLLLRFGGYDQLSVLLGGSGQRHQAGLIAALAIDFGGSPIGEVMPFLRIGMQAGGPRAGELTGLLGLTIEYGP